ncbi:MULTISPECIES: DNA methyltransferase [Enterococcus]|uniref:DNA methyltransferase n=1 Tax=Enterococcus TaxID=1350 RepID=UPI0019240676|nr:MULTISPECIES: DNA methyltransferase [Enterococcus]MBL1228295.1 DNA methylase [Enterococcus sp. BWB1-3]
MSLENEQLSFDSEQKENKRVTVLGMEFENDDARREYFREELRKKLPELKKIEGFPIGSDEDIISLSDPPYYTICPNPWLSSFFSDWKTDKNYTKDVEYPLAVDVSEGKNDPIYNAHSYHTKVPYKAIMRYMLYYTNPGDIVFDGFCGSGMTGVAAEMCDNKETVRDLMGDDFCESSVGYRKAMLIDLAPAATFISHNYNKKGKSEISARYLLKRLKKLREKYDWAFSTICEGSRMIKNDTNLRRFYEENKENFGEINYIVWSEVYICNSCTSEINYWDVAVSRDEKKVESVLTCAHCGARSEKKNLDKAMESHLDPVINKLVLQPKMVPVKINYSVNKKRYNKSPDWYDIKVINYFKFQGNYNKIPVVKFNNGIKTSEPIRNGMPYVHHVYTDRILSILNDYLDVEDTVMIDDIQFLLGSTLPKLTKMNRYMPQHGSRALVGPMANALYFPPLSVENNVLSQFEFQLKKIVKAWNCYSGTIISTQSSTKVPIANNSIDYIFIDPPFGANIMYSELSFIRESWLGVYTNNKKEAIENKSQGKRLSDYTQLMSDAFNEAFRILKPNKWITVEFSNTKASVWNALQFVIQNAGFVIASVDALDKKRGGFHSMITTTAVKQDLVISAYKPAIESVNKMISERNSEESAWTFIEQHLKKLPVFVGTRGDASVIVERTIRILYDRMVAYHVQNGLPVPISALNFQEEIVRRFSLRDGMIFLESQVVEYDKKRITAKNFSKLSLFVSDENSAIEWIRQQLLKKPQTRQDIQPLFMKEIMNIAKHEDLPELDDLLQQNFLFYNGIGSVPNQISTYLTKNYHELRGLDKDDEVLKEKAKNRWYVPNPNQQADLEKLREKNLLREFVHYLEEINNSKKKLKVFRTEAIRVGFKKAWTEKEYQTIVKVGERLPEKVIQEDDKLLMYFDNALMRVEM